MRTDHRDTPRPAPGDPQQRLDVQVPLDEVGEQIEPLLASAGEADARGRERTTTRPSGEVEHRRAQPVRLEGSMPHRARHPADANPAAEILGVRAAGDGDATVVVYPDAVAPSALPSENRTVFCGENVVSNRQHAEPGDAGRPARLDSVRVVHVPTEHLEPTADAEHRPPGLDMAEH